MKIIIQSFIISLVIHLLYIAGTMIVAYIKTVNYKVDIESSWRNVETLQNEVAFGIVGSPLILLFTLFGVAAISGFIIISYGKIVNYKTTSKNPF